MDDVCMLYGCCKDIVSMVYGCCVDVLGIFYDVCHVGVRCARAAYGVCSYFHSIRTVFAQYSHSIRTVFAQYSLEKTIVCAQTMQAGVKSFDIFN